MGTRNRTFCEKKISCSMLLTSHAVNFFSDLMLKIQPSKLQQFNNNLLTLFCDIMFAKRFSFKNHRVEFISLYSTRMASQVLQNFQTLIG